MKDPAEELAKLQSGLRLKEAEANQILKVNQAKLKKIVLEIEKLQIQAKRLAEEFNKLQARANATCRSDLRQQ